MRDSIHPEDVNVNGVLIIFGPGPRCQTHCPMTSFLSTTSGSRGACWLFPLRRLGDAFKHFFCGPVPRRLDAAITKIRHVFLPGQMHPLPNFPELGKLGHPFTHQRHRVGIGSRSAVAPISRRLGDFIETLPPARLPALRELRPTSGAYS